MKTVTKTKTFSNNNKTSINNNNNKDKNITIAPIMNHFLSIPRQTCNHKAISLSLFPKVVFLTTQTPSTMETTSSSSPSSSSSSSQLPPSCYLHVGPSGDCWTGPSIFAAKHLQPDYVKSIEIPQEFIGSTDSLLEILEQNTDLAFDIYDNETFPQSVLDLLKKDQEALKKE